MWRLCPSPTGVTVTFADGKLTVTDRKKKLLEGTYAIDPTKSPMTIDMTDLRPSFQTKTNHGLFKWKDDVLIICQSINPDDPRPAKFSGPEGLMRLQFCRPVEGEKSFTKPKPSN